MSWLALRYFWADKKGSAPKNEVPVAKFVDDGIIKLDKDYRHWLVYPTISMNLNQVSKHG